jgi:hypothetical protein
MTVKLQTGSVQPITVKMVLRFESEAQLAQHIAGLGKELLSILAESAPSAARRKLGRPKKYEVRPSAEKLEQDFTFSASKHIHLSATVIVKKMQQTNPEYANIAPTTIVRWLAEEKISIKEIKRRIRNEAAENRMKSTFGT